MRVVLTHGFEDSRVTLGMLQIEGVHHDPIYTLENPLRETSLDSRIPIGTYLCKPFSGNKYKDVYEVCDVPGRSYILFHQGNFERNTLGCILVGRGSGMLNDEPAVTSSRPALQDLRDLIGQQEFTLEIK